MRHLATIQRILSLDPIPGADAIEVASILGWKCVVKKGEFEVGDLCVYIEVDSLLPDRPEFEFMKPRGMRVRTVRLRGQVSQGLALPVTIFSGDTRYWAEPGIGFFGTEGEGVSEALGIVKYEPPIPAQLAGDAKGTFPGFIEKTDEERIQSMPHILEKCRGTAVRICEKMDGSSATYYVRDGEFGVCSRNQELKESEENSFWRVARKLDIEAKLRSLGQNIAIQGELIGEGVQGNKYKLKGQTVLFFNAYDIDKSRHLNVHVADNLFRGLGLEQVPELYDCNLVHTVDDLVKAATMKSGINHDVWAEGVVVRSINDIEETFITGKTVNRGRLSFKVINPEFLIKNNE